MEIDYGYSPHAPHRPRLGSHAGNHYIIGLVYLCRHSFRDMTANRDMWQRLFAHTATESDLKAIYADNEAELLANPKAIRCPEFEAFMSPLIWQIERMDSINGAEPTMADALAVFAELDSEV